MNEEARRQQAFDVTEKFAKALKELGEVVQEMLALAVEAGDYEMAMNHVMLLSALEWYVDTLGAGGAKRAAEWEPAGLQAATDWFNEKVKQEAGQ